LLEKLLGENRGKYSSQSIWCNIISYCDKAVQE
jgi:hypothetical protein